MTFVLNFLPRCVTAFRDHKGPNAAGSAGLAARAAPLQRPALVAEQEQLKIATGIAISPLLRRCLDIQLRTGSTEHCPQTHPANSSLPF
jgi:hypothetical protein